MADKMTVLFNKQTGHVMAALTHIADPTTVLPPETVARGGLRVRFTLTYVGATAPTDPEMFDVPPEELKSLNVDFSEALLLHPSAFQVDEKQQQALALSNSAALSTVTLAASTITINPTNAALASDTKVWVEITGGSLTRPIIKSDIIKTGDTEVIIPIETLTIGDYQVFVLAETYPPYTKTLTVT